MLKSESSKRQAYIKLNSFSHKLAIRGKAPGQIWRHYLADNIWMYILGGFFVALACATQVSIPRIMGWAIDFLRGDHIPSFFLKTTKMETFETMFLTFVVVVLLQMVARIGWRLTIARQTHKAGVELKKKIWEKARFFTQKDLDEKYTVGHLMNNSTSDVNTARFMFGFTLIGAFDVLFLGLFTLITMITISLEMTLWTMAVFLFLPFAVKKLTKIEGERYAEAQDYLSKFNDQGSQAVATIRMQRLTQTGSFWEKKLVSSADEFRKRRLKALFTSYYFFPFTGGSTVISYIVMFVIGIQMVMNGSLTVGEFITMQSLIYIMQDPLAELGFIISELQRSYTSLERLCEVYNRPQAVYLKTTGRDVKATEKVFQLKNIDFTYPEGERKIIDRLNLEINQKERIGIIGPVGTGKTTLLNILSGFIPNYQGELLFNGRPLREYSHPSLREYMAIVPQKAFLFADTVKKNVSLNSDMSDEEVYHYLDLAGLKYDVEQFPLKLETPLGEWGINLSGGQKQRLTMARALASKPKLLMLDDCLSAVDTVTEEKILTGLDKEMKETTLIWVAHRSSTLKYCDRVIEMNNGAN